jgi:homocysteine S-methyltransferase
MEDAIRLKNQGVDILTFADSPTGRARADSFLIASKVVNETGVRVMPHICCRDKNEIAVRSQILGAHINGIRDVLAVTGDPIPKASRGSVRGVFSFDSVRLMRLIAAMNGELFAKDPIRFGGAVNYTRANLDVEADRILRKAEAGASFFLTQPVYGKRDVETILWLKRRTGAVILVGLMPLIGLRNAVFVKNELPGIRVPDALVERYERESGGDGDGGDGNAAAAAGGGNSAAAGGAGREAGERIGVEAARDVIRATAAEADGYYFILPFNRVHLVPRILEGGLL